MNIIAGTLNLVMGMIHMILSFVPSFPPPNPVMINWQNWKDFSAEGLDLARPKHFSVEVSKPFSYHSLRIWNKLTGETKQSNVAIRLKSPPPPVHHHIQPMHSVRAVEYNNVCMYSVLTRMHIYATACNQTRHHSRILTMLAHH